MNNKEDGHENLTILVQVAHLYYDGNLSQQEIAAQMGVSRSLIAHYLKKARQQGLVSIQIRDPRDACKEIAGSILEKSTLKNVVVVTGSRASIMLTRRAVAGAVARYMEANLKDGDVLGLGWGRTNMEVMNVVTQAVPRRMEVVPLMGESSYAGTYSQVNQMVLQFTRNFGAKPHFLLAPMVVSSRHLRDVLIEDAAVHEAAMCWGRLTHAFIGIGALPSVEGQVLYLGEENTAKLIKAGAVGDITSRFFNESGKFIQIELHERILGIEIDQLKRVKNVLAAVCGVDKVRATMAALRTGMITDLFIDEELGRALLIEMEAQGMGVEVDKGGR